jgi:hypothetical protein
MIAKWYWKLRSTISSGSLHGVMVTKQRPNNSRGEWSNVTTITVSRIKENSNATTGSMT